MKFSPNRGWLVLVLFLPLTSVLPACLQAPGTQGDSPQGQQAAAMPGNNPAPRGGIPIPPAVRDNMGITFAAVQQRAVAETRRVPGQFELLPTARQEYRAPVGGRVEVKAAQFDAVTAGDVLLTIDSPEWRRIQHEAVEAEGDITMADATLQVARARLQEARSALAKQEERLGNLAEVNVRNAALEAEATTLRSSLPRLEAEVRAQEAGVREAREHYTSRLNALSSVTGIPVAELRELQHDEAAWRAITVLPIRAEHDGVVENLAVSDGGWLEAGELAMNVLDPEKIRFHAEAPQTDIALFAGGQAARIVPPQGGSVDMQSGLDGTLTLGLTAHERDRTVSLYVTPREFAPWAKAGVGGFLEVTLTADAEKQLAVPSAAIIQDGLEHVFYRRDPKDPDRALRVNADMGVTDGRWTVLRSGVKEGDEVVLDGVYALKLTSSGQQAPEGYHYHADGALHTNH